MFFVTNTKKQLNKSNLVLKPNLNNFNKKNENGLNAGIVEGGSSCNSITHCVSPTQITKKLHIQELRKIFTYKTDFALEKSEKFLKNKSWINEKKWKMGKITRDLEKEYKDRYVKTVQIWKEIEFTAKHLGLTPIFFTGTVVGELHPFTINSNKRKKNWNINYLNLAYKELQQLHTDIRIQAKRTLKYAPNFIRAIEPHKTFMPHSHVVYFVKKEDIEKFKNIINNKIKLNKNIGKTETTVINSYNKDKHYSPVSYLIKYLQKNAINTGNINDLKVLDGWKNTLKIKQLYNNSLYLIPKWAIKKISYFYKNFNKNNKNNEYRSMLDKIESEVEIVNDSIQLDGTIKRKEINIVDNPKYKIYRKIQKTEYINDNDGEFYATDKILEYTIIDNNNIVLYNKKDYVFIDDYLLKRYKCNLQEKEKDNINAINTTTNYIELIEKISLFDYILEYEYEKYYKNNINTTS